MDWYLHPGFFPLYWRDRFVRGGIIVATVGAAALWLGLLLAIKQLPEIAFLHYNIYFGIDLIGSRYQLLVLPAIGSVVLVINGVLGAVVFPMEKALTYFLVGAAVLTQLLFILAAVFLLFVNF